MGIRYSVSAPETIDVWYGWAHHGRMCRMLAAEEGVRLEAMEGFGGATPWTPAVSAVAPILGPDSYDRREVSVDECRQMRARLEEISIRWDQGRFAEPVEDEMAADQAVSLHKMLSVIARCIESGKPMIIS